MSKTYMVKEIFGPTLQGEGSHAGTVVSFLRFAGCNRWTGLEKDREKSFCKFCDTDFRGGTKMNAHQILAALEEKAAGIKRVVISGGEPTLQLDAGLLSVLKGNRWQVHLETNGSKALGELRGMIDHVTLSPKQPREETRLEECDDLKILYPLLDPRVTPEAFAGFPCSTKYLQPVMDKEYPANLKATICRILGNPDWKLSLQTHKITGVQ